MRLRFFHLLIGFCGFVAAQELPESGEAIYARLCEECHGKGGSGVPDEVDEPLYGERSLPSLSRFIDRRMPDEKPELLNADESRRVAEYIYGEFYSPEARAKKLPAPKPVFARLTNRQFRESVADLVGSFVKMQTQGPANGLKGSYFQSDGMNKKVRKALERVDNHIDFDFGEGPPADGITADQYSIAWDGSLIAPASGWYEFRITTPNGARLYLNSDRQDGDGNFRDDSGAKREPALIDAWVSSGSEPRELSARLFLLGGRAYPIRLDYFKYQEKRGMLRLEWKAPRGVWEILEAPYLSPSLAATVAVSSTLFPADDASEGYERGTGISKDWHEATTAAAIEIANQVVLRLARLSGSKDDAPDRMEKLKAFTATFAERAFRRPLSAELRELYVEKPFAGASSPEQAVKRAVILILKSPRFLYPDIGATKDDFTVASRLALGLWDSLPDKELLEAAGRGQLRTVEQVKSQCARMVADPRAKAKLKGFFQHWLKLDVESDLAKDPAAFPGFDDALVADLRRSLELFVERVVWSDASDYRELMEADYMLFNERLGKFYGVSVSSGNGFEPVKLDPEQRAGVLTHPYLLARLSHRSITSPIHRGVFLTRNVLGNFLKPPPKAIAFEDHPFDPKLTTREKVAVMTSNAACMACHDTINPLGFALEHFDPVGRFRNTEGDKPIDASADFPTEEGETLRLNGPRDVALRAVQSDTSRQGFIRQLFQSTIKQNPSAYGFDRIHKLDSVFTSSNYHIRNLLVEINVAAALHDIPNPDQANR